MSSSSKQYDLAPSKVINEPTLATSKTSLVTNVLKKDNITYQYVWTGTLNGTFIVETSLDYIPNENGVPQSGPLNAGTWNTLPGITGAVASGTPDSGTIEMNQLGAPYVRTTFTRVSGTGSLVVTISGKAE